VDFTRERIVEALTEVGERLYHRRKIGDVAVYGGSAMILQFDVAFITQDVDAIVNSEHGEVMRAVQEVGREKGWSSSWLNEGASVYVSPRDADDMSHYGSFPSEDRVGLRVYVAKPEYLLALKLRALRIGSRDVEDVLMLARHLGVRTIEEFVAVVGRNFPNEQLDVRKRLVLSDIVDQLSR